MSADDLISVVMFAIIDCSAIFANTVLIVAIAKSTPRHLRSYSVLLLNTAIVDSLSAFFSVAAVSRMQSENGVLVFTPVGPCTRFGARACHQSVFLQAALISHSTVLLFISLCYRLWMSRSSLTNFGQPRIRSLLLIVIPATAPSILLFAVNDAAATYDGCTEASVCSKLKLWPVTADNLLAPAAFGVLFAVYGVEFLAVIIAQRLLLQRLRKLNSTERARHQMIFYSLTAQMLLPLASVIGCAAFAIDFLGIVQSTWLQRSVILIGSTLALGAPLVNLYFLRPYRKFVVDLFRTAILPQESRSFQ